MTFNHKLLKAPGTVIASLFQRQSSEGGIKSLKKRSLLHAERGATAVEYALTLSLLAVFVVTPLSQMGIGASTTFNDAGNALVMLPGAAQAQGSQGAQGTSSSGGGQQSTSWNGGGSQGTVDYYFQGDGGGSDDDDDPDTSHDIN